jgi:hypothetical protein
MVDMLHIVDIYILMSLILFVLTILFMKNALNLVFLQELVHFNWIAYKYQHIK